MVPGENIVYILILKENFELTRNWKHKTHFQLLKKKKGTTHTKSNSVSSVCSAKKTLNKKWLIHVAETVSPQTVRLLISVKEDTSSEEVRWEQLNRHPGYTQSTLVQLYLMDCPGTPPFYPHPDFHTLAPVAVLEHKHKVTGDINHQHLLAHRDKGESQTRHQTPGLAASQSQNGYWDRLAGPSRDRVPEKEDVEATEETWQCCASMAKRAVGDLKCWSMARFVPRLHLHRLGPLC